MRMSQRALVGDIATYVAYLLIFLFFAGPLLWLVSLSIRTQAEVFVSDIRLFPNNPTLENYVRRSQQPAVPDLPLERPEARGDRRLRRDALRHARRLRPVAFPLRLAQGLDDRPCSASR